MRVDELVSIIGADATIAVLNANSGQRIYIPQTPTDKFTMIVGNDKNAALALVKSYGGQLVTMPSAIKFRFSYLQAKGYSLPDISRLLGRSVKTCEKISIEIKRGHSRTGDRPVIWGHDQKSAN